MRYVRVSKEEQNEALQMDALKKYGCDKIFHEKVSGISKSKPEFEKVKEILRVGDELTKILSMYFLQLFSCSKVIRVANIAT